MVITKTDRDFINTFCAWLHDNTDFYNVWTDGMSDSECSDWRDRWFDDLHNQFSCYCSFGATKIVFDFDNIGEFVLKLPLNSISKGCRFSYCSDYCLRELENYQRAVDADVSEFFAETCFVCDYCGIPVYAQTKVVVDEDEVCGEMNDYYDDINEDYDYSSECVQEWLTGRADYKASRLLDFLCDNEINDLHTGNIGFMECSPIIFDYSGYHK